MQRFLVCLAALAAAVSVVSAQRSIPRRVLSGPVAAGGQNRAALREWDATVDRMVRTGELARRTLRADTLMAGRSHERFVQYVRGVRVVGGDVTRQIRNGMTESIFGRIHEVEGPGTDPTLTPQQARTILNGLSSREPADDRPIELVLVPRDDGRFVLAYEAHVRSAAGWMRTYLDAHSGDVVLQYNDLQTQAAVGTGIGVFGDTKKISTRAMGGTFVADDELRPPVLVTYDMQGNLARTEAYLDGVYRPAPSDVASDADNEWTDGANVDAHVYLGWTYDYLFRRFGRRGLDDRNAPIFAITHPVRRSDLATLPDSAFDYVLNAFWCESCGPDRQGAMMFGEGLPPGFVNSRGQYVDFLASALDIVAHELTHGLTSYSSDLIYRNESGALNESFSDILGTGAEFFYQPPGSGSRQADYLVAEDAFRPGGIRSMSDPLSHGDPDHYSRRFLGTEDNGGVHINSGISNHACYLAIEGGANRTSGLRVTGVGAANREQIEKAFFRAFVFMLPSNATFSTARAATIQAARDLYGAGSAAERAITEAWTAVGVQ